MRWTLIAFLLLFATNLRADEFRRAAPGYSFVFPRDHGSHPDFRTEWWYFTGNVEDPTGRPFGFKMTIFRSAQAPPGTTEAPLAADQVFLCHFAISDIANRDHGCWESIGREGFGQAHASTTTLDVALKDFTVLLGDDGAIRLGARQDHAALDLTLTPAKPFVIHGKDGLHQKADLAGQASHYITFTRLNTTGTLRWRGTNYTVTGLSWMDHEFGSDYLSDQQAGWDWFAIQLDNGYDLMLYQLRNKDGSANTHSIGSIVDPKGNLIPVDGAEFSIRHTTTWKSPANSGVYPMGWNLTFAERPITLGVSAAFPEQEMTMDLYTHTAYWEGATRITGTWEGKPVTGKGYTELVGYAGEFNLL